MSLTPAAVGAIKFALAAGAGLVLLAGILLRRGGRPAAGRRLRAGLLAALGIASAFGWWNFFEFRYSGGFGHPLDVYHYYIGAKYFEELGYTRLYECSSVAEAEFGDPEQVASRSIRNLETYRRESAALVLADPERCTRHFDSERWEVFVRDIAWFRERIPEGLWRGALSDFGYNPSPVWGTVARVFIADGPVSEENLAPVLLLDPLLLVGMWGLAWWAFGWRATCVALVFWGTNLPADYTWTGGAFLRHLWLAGFVGGLASLKLGRFATGGFLLGISALLRIFPAVAIAAVAAAAAIDAWRRRSPTPAPEMWRFGAGVGLAVVACVPWSLAALGGLDAWREFAANIVFHAGTLFAANVGAAIFLAGLPELAHSILLAAVALLYTGLLLRAVDGEEAWAAAALGGGAVVIFTTMSNYYYGVLLGFAFLCLRRDGIGALLCALAASGWCLSWAVPTLDRLYVWISVTTVLGVLAMTAAVRGRDAPPAPPDAAPATNPEPA